MDSVLRRIFAFSSRPGGTHYPGQSVGPTDIGPIAEPANCRHERHNHVRRDRVDDTDSLTLRVNGRLHHIGVGRTHARTHVLILIQDLNIGIIKATGHLIRDLTRGFDP